MRYAGVQRLHIHREQMFGRPCKAELVENAKGIRGILNKGWKTLNNGVEYESRYMAICDVGQETAEKMGRPGLEGL